MKITCLKQLTAKDYKRITSRSGAKQKTILPSVQKIMLDVKKRGDDAILEKYRKRYGANYSTIVVSKKEIQNAYKNVNKKFIDAIQQMIRNISAVHKMQLTKKKDTTIIPETGITVGRIWRAIEKVGIYIPGGKAVYPSSVLMTAIPAIIAGCKEIILCSPPGSNGIIPSPTLVSADLCGIKTIYNVGGVEAIAAFTYGTKTIPQVYKIFGAGNAYVTVAKIEALQTVAIDMPAGPSEVFIIAD